MNKLIEKLIVNTLTAREYLLAFLLYTNKQDFIKEYETNIELFTEEDCNTLVKKGFITGGKNGFIITEKLKSLFQDYKEGIRGSPPQEKVHNWIDDWYNLFPKRVRSGGYPIRCDKNGCLKKLIKFCKDHPEYDKEIIFKATEYYINTARQNDYQYMKLAPYFIEKDGISMLSGECENIVNRMENINNGKAEEKAVNYGEDI